VWAWFGGLLGTVYVLVVITTTPKLGVGTMVGLTVAGQMMMAVALDHFGLLGLERHPISLGRLAGMVLLIAGVVLLKRY
jgi:transporter family-2 protein